MTGILLQLLGDGILTDSLGRTVSFKNAIVVMTSNLTGTQTGKPGLGFTPDCEDVRAQTVLREAFSPEFLGRIDCVTTFRPLTAADLGAIARLQLRQLAERLQKQNVTLTAAPDLPERLGTLCAHDPGGARSLRRRLQTLVEGPAAELLLRVRARAARALGAGDRRGGSGTGLILKQTFKNSEFDGFSRKMADIPRKIFSKKGCNLCKQNVLYY